MIQPPFLCTYKKSAANWRVDRRKYQYFLKSFLYMKLYLITIQITLVGQRCTKTEIDKV